MCFTVVACKMSQQCLVTIDVSYIEEWWEHHLSIQPLLMASCVKFYPNCMFPWELIHRMGRTRGKSTICAAIGKEAFIPVGHRLSSALGSPKFLPVTPHPRSVSQPKGLIGSPGWTLMESNLVVTSFDPRRMGIDICLALPPGRKILITTSKPVLKKHEFCVWHYPEGLTKGRRRKRRMRKGRNRRRSCYWYCFIEEIPWVMPPLFSQRRRRKRKIKREKTKRHLWY